MNNELDNLILRGITKEDAIIITDSMKNQGWNKPISQYETYLKYQESGERDIIIAELEKKFAGYLTINWISNYVPFRKKGIPEIVDLNVLKKLQRKGIGTILMNEAERRIKRISKYAGIGFGVTEDYGAAQILYVNRNYKPDGKGLVVNSKPLKYGDQIIINDDIVFYLIKKL